MGVLPVSATDTNSELDMILHPGTVREVCCQTEETMIPENLEDPLCVCLLENNISLGTHRQTEFNAVQYSSLDRHWGTCWYSGEITQMDGYICFDCWCLMTLCCSVSCLVTIATTCLIRIDQFVGGRNPFAWGMDLLCNRMTPFDATRLCVKMNQDFKGGFDNVRTRYNDTVDSRGLTQCADGQQCLLVHFSTGDTPIRETRRLGSYYTPVPASDWPPGGAAHYMPAGNARIGYIRRAVDRGQSINAAPVTGLLVSYTFLRYFRYCAAGYTSCWTFCDTVYEDGSAYRNLLSGSVLFVYTTIYIYIYLYSYNHVHIL